MNPLKPGVSLCTALQQVLEQMNKSRNAWGGAFATPNLLTK